MAVPAAKNMIRTNIPYDFNIIDDIANNGAIVDMSLCSFSNDIEQNVKTALIYLKNTGFKHIELDFSNASKLFKTTILRQYVESCQDFFNTELVCTWKSILSTYTHFNSAEFKSILTDIEIAEFIEHNTNLVETVCRIMKSAPLFLLKKLKVQKTIQIQSVDNNISLKNISNLIDNNLLLHICKKHNANICDYLLMFNDDNMLLFNALNKTDLSFILSVSLI